MLTRDSARPAVLVLAVLLGAGAAHGSALHAQALHPVAPGEAGVTTPDEVVITAREYEFDAPEEIEAGAVTFRLVNEGEEIHHALIVRLDEGRTFEDLRAALAEEPPQGPPPPWITFMGGPNAPAPGGGEANATMVLRPGNYALLCVIPDDEDGAPHFAHGMMQPLTVTPSSDERETLSEPDALIMLSDHEFELSEPLTAGTHTVRVRNFASQWHELQILRLRPGTTLDDVTEWAAALEAGEMVRPPGMPIGGVGPLAQSLSNDIVVDLEPGDYAFLCFLPDVSDGMPHFEHGMVQIITVDGN